ncbi:hypothetical protein AMK26_32525 [Streptomyces sp. CB03234]|uniref:DUF6777 domain-containing protein n=1 Tax=Streptomyces sp. (strain CB03234) TaxID=1703937 RepID=UPI00093AA42C|nr:DUF6777 domain-containing protein [Streptomyces sp. CB03234]OKJ94552.1 hypothetical protein AMK26_32525 [Streptomyces sp. CB03234]
MRSPIRRRRYAVLARPAALLLAAGLLVAGCGGDGKGGTRAAVNADEVHLQPAGAPGPHPFTASTVRPSPGTPTSPPPRQAVDGPGPRTLPGSTPGLYGAERSVPSCDVERQLRLLTADDTKARAFAQAAGIGPAGIAPWLRGLTPVVLRADTRVTGHGYRDGSAAPFQSVLQAGTAVLVDQYGAPRVRCACGNPLRSPVVAQGATVDKGTPWPGYHPGRVVAITPTQQVVHSLIVVNVLDNTWLERLTGSGGEQDKQPEVPPPYAPGERDLVAPPVPADCPTEPGGTRPVPPGCPTPPPPPPPPVPPTPDGPGGPAAQAEPPAVREEPPAGPDEPPAGPDEPPAVPEEPPAAPDDPGDASDPVVPPDAPVPDSPGGPDQAGQPQDMPFEPDLYEG